MGVEVRLSDVRQLDDVLGLDIDAVSLGSDGCAYKVPDAGTLKSAHDRVVGSGKAFKVVTPFLTCNHYDAMMRLVHSLAEWDAPVQIVANDYALLHGAKEVWASSKLKPVAGICLSCSYGQVVRGYEIAEGFNETLAASGLSKEDMDLSQWILDVLSQNSMHCRIRVKLLKEKYHVMGTEVQLVEGVVPSLKRIRGLGLELTAHSGRVVATMSRACPTARFFKQSPPACTDRCNKVTELTAKRIVSLGIAASSSSAEAEKRILDAMPAYFVHGNVILRQGMDGPDCVEPDSLDHVLFDVRDQSRDDLAAKCKAWKNSGKVK